MARSGLQPALVAALLGASGCVTVVSQESDALGGAPAYEEAAAPPDGEGAPAAQAFVGLELEEAIAGSLEEMEFLGGLRVASVAPASPAEGAAIRAGDRVVAAQREGSPALPLERLDQWSAFLSACAPGDAIRLTVERDGGLVEVPLLAAARAAGARPPARRFVERRKARCVVETELVEIDGRTRSAARVIELAPSSPLSEAGLAPGARLLALDGVELAGAADFARRVAALPYGEDLELEVADARGRRTVDFELWEPERHLTALQLWPLFAWAEPADESATRFELVDLWLIWLFKYERQGETRRSSILRFIAWETGAGALVEEPSAEARRG